MFRDDPEGSAALGRRDAESLALAVEDYHGSDRRLAVAPGTFGVVKSFAHEVLCLLAKALR